MVRYKVHQTTVGLLERMHLNGVEGPPTPSPDEAAKASATAGGTPRPKRSAAKGRHAARAVSR
jgi:hypothetical protein